MEDPTIDEASTAQSPRNSVADLRQHISLLEDKLNEHWQHRHED